MFVHNVLGTRRKSARKFSKENSKIPSPISPQLQGLIQIGEMLIACALPVMGVNIKCGGQRGYSGHCMNLPQNVTELASLWPPYLKDRFVIIVNFLWWNKMWTTFLQQV